MKIISNLSPLLPIVLFLLFFKRNNKGKLWVIFLYSFLSWFTDALYGILQRLFKGYANVTQFYLFSSFTIIEYTLFTYYLYYHCTAKSIKLFILITSVLFYLFSFYNLAFPKSYSFDSLSASVECILVIAFAILYLYEQLNNPQIIFIYTTKTFWIIVAFLIYLAATLFLFINAQNLTKSQWKSYWNINYTFNILKNIIIAAAFLIKNSPQNQSSMRKPYNI